MGVYRAVVMWMALGLTACAGQVSPLPDERYYHLSEPQAAPAPRPIDGIAAVSLPQTDGLHSERALLYSMHDRPLEVLRHHYFFWAESPPRLVQQHLIEYLRNARAATQVLRTEDVSTSAVQLHTRLLRFERIVGGSDPRVLVELELQWQAPGRAGTPWRTYRATVPGADDSIYASVTAFGTALTEIYNRFLNDVPPP